MNVEYHPKLNQMKITMMIHQQSTMSMSTSGIRLGIAVILLAVTASVERVSVPLYSDLVWTGITDY